MTDIIDLIEIHGYISSGIASLLRTYCDRWHVTGYRSIIEANVLSEDALADALSSNLKLDRLYNVGFNSAIFNPGESLPYERAKDWCCIETEAIRQSYEREFAIADPTRLQTLAQLKNLFGMNIRFVVAPASEIESAIRDTYPIWSQVMAVQA